MLSLVTLAHYTCTYIYRLLYIDKFPWMQASKPVTLTDSTKFNVNTQTHTTHVRRQKKRSASYHFTIHRNCFSLLHAYYCIICSLCINIPELDWQLAPCATPTTVHFRIGVRTAFFLGSSRYKSSLYRLALCSIH